MLLILFKCMESGDGVLYMFRHCNSLKETCGNYDVVWLLIFHWVKGVTIKIQNHK